MSQRVWVREFDPQRDLERCMAIWETASRLAHPFLGPEALAADRVLVRDIYITQAEIEVAGAGQAADGFLALIRASPVGHIGALFVAPEAQRGGIGRRLVESAAARRGPLTVEVYAANAGARAFYVALGFRATGSRAEDDRGRPHPLIAMTRIRDAAVSAADPVAARSEAGNAATHPAG